MALGQNGLLKNAKFAQEKYENAQVLENQILLDYENLIQNDLSSETKIISIKTMLIECGIYEDYTMEELVDENEDTGDALTKILNNQKAVNYMLENVDDYIVKLCSTEKGIDALSKSNYIQTILLNDDAYDIIKTEISENNGQYSTFEENTRIELMLTSNDNVIYSSEYVEGYEAFRAFDGNTVNSVADSNYGKNKIWISQVASSKVQEFIGYNFNKVTTLYEIEYWARYNEPWGNQSNGFRYFPSFTVQGSNGDKNNDGEDDWDVINLKESDDVENNKVLATWGSGTENFCYHKVLFEEPVTYKKYRLFFDVDDIEYNNDCQGYFINLAELRWYGK